MMCKIYIVVSYGSWDIHYTVDNAEAKARILNGIVLDADYDYDTMLDCDTFYGLLKCLDVTCLPRLLAMVMGAGNKINERYADAMRTVLEKYEEVTA